jgi:hypothetical protein
MPKRTVDFALQVMDNLKQSGADIVPASVILRKITIFCGARQETRTRYFEFMQQFGFIEMTDEKTDAGQMFKINYEKAAEMSL